MDFFVAGGAGGASFFGLSSESEPLSEPESLLLLLLSLSSSL